MITTIQDQAFTVSGTMSDLVVHSSTWEAEAYQRAIALKDLAAGWDHRQGRPPTTAAINSALSYISLVAELNLPALGGPFIAPMSEGGVQLEWDQGDRHVEIEITPDGVAKWIILKGQNILPGDFGPAPKELLIAIFGWLTAMP